MSDMNIQISSSADLEELLEEGRTIERSRFGKLLKWYVSTIHAQSEAKTRGTITPESMHEQNRQLGVSDACREFMSPLYGLEAFLNDRRQEINMVEEVSRALDLEAMQVAQEQVSPH